MQEDTGVYQVRPGVGLTLLMELDDVLCWGGVPSVTSTVAAPPGAWEEGSQTPPPPALPAADTSERTGNTSLCLVSLASRRRLQ